MIQKHSGEKKLRDVWRHLILHPRISSRLHQTRKADLRIEQIWRWTKEGERRLFELRKYNQQTEFAADPRISTVNSDSWNLMDLISNETTFWNSILLQKYEKNRNYDPSRTKLWSFLSSFDTFVISGARLFDEQHVAIPDSLQPGCAITKSVSTPYVQWQTVL